MTPPKMSSSGWTTQGEKSLVDSQEVINAFLTAAHGPTTKEKKKVLPVPGKPPHLWHLFQGDLQTQGSEQPNNGDPSTEGKTGLQGTPESPANPSAGDPSPTNLFSKTPSPKDASPEPITPQNYHSIKQSARNRGGPEPSVPSIVPPATRGPQAVPTDRSTPPAKKKASKPEKKVNSGIGWIEYDELVNQTREEAETPPSMSWTNCEPYTATRQVMVNTNPASAGGSYANALKKSVKETQQAGRPSSVFLEHIRRLGINKRQTPGQAPPATGWNGIQTRINQTQQEGEMAPSANGVINYPTNLGSSRLQPKIEPQRPTSHEQDSGRQNYLPPLSQSFVASGRPDFTYPAESGIRGDTPAAASWFPRSNNAVASPGIPLTEGVLRAATNGMGPEQANMDSRIRQSDPAWYGPPRPNKHYVSSSRDSMSMPSVSTIVSDNGATGPGTKISETRTRSDIRNSIAPKHNIQDYGDKWMKYNWATDDGRDDDDVFITPSFISSFVTAWMADVPDHVYATFLEQKFPEHWKCDVDTNSGRLLSPVEYPDTLVDLATLDPQLSFRRQNFSSSLLIRRKLGQVGENGQTGDRKPVKNRRGQAKLPRLGSVMPPASVESFGPGIPNRNKVSRVPRSTFSPNIPCFLRPAEKKDMGAVATIYNCEVKDGIQTLDSTPVSVQDIEDIFNTTEKLGMPFIVAVRGSARDLEPHKGNAEYSIYTQLAPYVADPLDVKQNGTILGFAYLSVWEPGIAGNGNGSSRATARINLFVDPKYRRKKIGFSLLDKLIATVSQRFSSESAYDFVDLSNSPVYKHPLGHKRQYFHLYLNYFVKHVHKIEEDSELEREQETYNDDFVWVKKLLEEKFNFTEKVRFESVHRSNKLVQGRPVYWLDSVVFEHTCHFDARFTTDY
ncbi:hypothetical protein B0H66DRAFT_210106 [Apodospora peruviana]|uniref:N-acetyltransferase domain-containing protein n=1 Tax=Apodospora peruviana TaxID=516989 RepID=A0AAE0M8A9_9PEZI|nr:hypothetical protein B0H66DRAFT_210106 [Apodospora peruviana]